MRAAASKICVVVVDDSAAMRGLLSEIVNGESDMQAIGSACDPHEAREMIRSLDPDVITLDMQMPRMNGLDFLERLMRLRPMPVVVVSGSAHGDVGEKALALGALELVSKPNVIGADGLAVFTAELTSKIRSAVARGVRPPASPAAAPPREARHGPSA